MIYLLLLLYCVALVVCPPGCRVSPKVLKCSGPATLHFLAATLTKWRYALLIYRYALLVAATLAVKIQLTATRASAGLALAERCIGVWCMSARNGYQGLSHVVLVSTLSTACTVTIANKRH